MSFQTRSELKQAYAQKIRATGRSVSIDVPVGDRGNVDILTDKEAIFCVLELNEQSANQLRSQLDFYGRFSPSWEKVVVAGQVSDLSAAATLTDRNIKVINLSETIPEVSPKYIPRTASKQVHAQSEFIYRYPELDSVEGGKGLRAALSTMGVVFLLGVAISLI